MLKALEIKELTLKKERFFVVLLAAIQFSHIVDFVVLMPLGPTLMRDLNINPLQFGSLVSSYNISAAVTGLAYGLIADRFGRKFMMEINFVGFILGTILCGLADSYESLLIARIIAGGFGGTLTAVTLAMVTDLIPFQRRGKAMGTVMSAFSVASVVGVPIGLVIAEKFSWHFTFYFIAIFSLFVLIVSSLSFPKLNEHVQITSALDNLKRVLKLLFKKDYIKAYSLIFLNVFSLFTLIPYLSPYAVKNIGIMETDLKYMYLVGGFFTIITARFIGKATDRFGAVKILCTLALVSTIPLYLYSHAGIMNLIPFIAMSTFFMTMVSGRMIPLMTMTSEISEPQDRGTYMGLLNSVRSFGSAVATLFAGVFIYEATDGKLVGFDTVGYYSIGFSILVIFGAIHVNSILQRRRHEQ
jgi:multidrug resistance protein